MPLVDVFRYYSDREPTAEKPFRLNGWVWATNGHVLVALRDDGQEAVEAPERYVRAGHYLTDAPAVPLAVSLKALRSFAGKVLPAHVDCDGCEGTGRDEHSESIECEHCGRWTRPPCTDCGGDGEEPIEIRHGRVADVPVNLVLLAFGLSLVPDDDTVTLGGIPSLPAKSSAAVAKDSAAVALAVLGDGWRVVVMSRRDESLTVPTFPPVAATMAEA